MVKDVSIVTSKAVLLVNKCNKSLEVTEDYDLDMIINEIDNNVNRAWFSLTDVKNPIENCFNTTEENGHVYFSGMLNFDNDLINNISSENQESNKEIICQNIAESLLMSIEARITIEK
ncbi:14082_t:CDS:2 [Racocetra fulgida]|uniref:14082_t:CDS:1 n=1 Tax=Racocetra fulgida TaxID=60492 RepID=A0A9N9BKF9_9GLOM|nr:14082_t:CDS:2 [Racocetra fulgida]